MKIIFLGTNGWYDTQTGNTICTLIETKKEFLILDAGNGLYKVDQYIKTKKPIYLFLCHFHFDHIIGLHILYKFQFPQGIKIIGPSGTKKILSKIIRQPFTVPLEKLRTKVSLHKLGKKLSLPLNFDFRKLRHSCQCYGYRFYLEDKIVTYCPDTGICKNLYYLARKADLVISECSYRSGQQVKWWPHLNPEVAAQVALDSGAKNLALTHFGADLYPTLKIRKKAERAARKIFKNTFAARDGQEIRL